MTSSHERQTIPEGRVQGPRETITYRVKTTRWGGSPTDPVLQVLIPAEDSDVTESVAPSATPTVEGDDILVNLSSLVSGKFYEVNVHFTCEGQELSTFFNVPCA